MYASMISLLNIHRICILILFIFRACCPHDSGHHSWTNFYTSFNAYFNKTHLHILSSFLTVSSTTCSDDNIPCVCVFSIVSITYFHFSRFLFVRFFFLAWFPSCYYFFCLIIFYSSSYYYKHLHLIMKCRMLLCV